ncbi:MAG: BLUF domain-containing protein [Planctomycetes bacterium]|nr:BLUF domain-containing protein [Planctomycetota bacterium]
MKRLAYVSRATSVLAPGELQTIATAAQANNRRLDITGVLTYDDGVFFQELEGPEAAVDALADRIRVDPRHRDMVVISVENGDLARHHPAWAMRVINLGDEPDSGYLRPVIARLSQAIRTVGRYTQPAVFRLLESGIDPTTAPARRVQRAVLCCDVRAFSAFAQALAPDRLAAFITVFVDVCVGCVSARGGEVTKIIGDAVLAHFPRECSGEALAAALDILTTLARIRRQAAANAPERYLHVGVGLAAGEVFEGNVGSGFKLDYTILGDPVNHAARLEALTRTQATALLFEEAFAASLPPEWSTIAIGRHHLKGRDDQTTISTVDLPIVRELPSSRLAEELAWCLDVGPSASQSRPKA